MVSPFIRQTWIVSGILMNMVSIGMTLSFTSCLIPALQAPDSPIKTDVTSSSWLASCIGLANIPGFLFSAVAMGIFGRRNVHIFSVVPSIVGCIIIYFANSMTILLIGRCFSGFSAGICVNLGAIVIGEYSDPKYRGSFLSLKTASVCIGSTALHLFGNYLHWRTIALINIVPCCYVLINTYTWPESPSYLALRKEFYKCEETFLWLRGNNDHSIKELKDLIVSQKEMSEIVNNSWKTKVIEFLKKFKRRDFIIPLFIMFLVSAMLESGGRHIFPAFASQIMGQITGNKTQSFYYTLCIDLTTILSATCSSVLVKMYKRRTVLFASGISAVIMLLTISLYLYLASAGVISKDRTWIPITMLIVYFLVVGFGCTPIPLAVLGEIFPLRHRGAGSGVAGIIMALWLMTALKVTPPLLEAVHVQGSFTVFAVIIALSTLILYFILPETKDKTLPEIEFYFNHGKFREEHNTDIESMTKMVNTNNNLQQ